VVLVLASGFKFISVGDVYILLKRRVGKGTGAIIEFVPDSITGFKTNKPPTAVVSTCEIESTLAPVDASYGFRLGLTVESLMGLDRDFHDGSPGRYLARSSVATWWKVS
jgi:hypothetical protein